MVTSIADVRPIVMKLLWRLVTLCYMQYLTTAYMTSYTTRVHQTPQNVRIFTLIFYTIPLQDNLSMIKVSIPGLKLELVKGVKEKFLQ